MSDGIGGPLPRDMLQMLFADSETGLESFFGLPAPKCLANENALATNSESLGRAQFAPGDYICPFVVPYGTILANGVQACPPLLNKVAEAGCFGCDAVVALSTVDHFAR
jgi:hypothetical protein